ncbi:MAG: IMP dehydrogenase [Spirochaetales bacterium]|nr:IMP dehydrogenase [Spirochaetales bacterium]
MNITEGLSFDDVLVIPSYSEVLPQEINTKTVLAGNITLNVPVISAAMDTVTEEELAIAMALEGGAGVIHMNLSPEEQARQVGRVKRFLNWIIDRPVTVDKNEIITNAIGLMEKHGISGLPVLDNDKLCGILTRRDLRFLDNHNKKVEEVMTHDLITESESVNIESAQTKFNKHRIEKLPVIDQNGKLVGLITVKDLEKHHQFPDATLDKKGRLIVGAAVSPLDYTKRMPLLIQNKVDFVVVDTAHGDSKNVLSAVSDIKKNYPNICVIGGNTATREGTKNLIDAGADAVKVGVGPGSICTTRIVAGIGMPQFSAILECAAEAEKSRIPVIADGGIKYSGDITKAIAAGAATVMIGNLFAGLKEAPGREIIFEGRMFKAYRGMGSIGAMSEGSGDRYQKVSGNAVVPEGIEGRVPYKGDLQPFLYQLVSGLKKGMGYCGCSNIGELRKYKKFVKITAAGLKESHAHDVYITQEAPNYSMKYGGSY